MRLDRKALDWLGRIQVRLSPETFAAGTALFAAVAFLHFVALDRAPSGFFVDEAGIAYAARGIAVDGHDEHGTAWPLYFQSFGDYKNPVGIYITALAIRVTGSWDIVTLRSVSSGLMLLAAVLAAALVWARLRDRWLALGMFAVAGTLPWFFAVGRTAFEVAALPACLFFFLLLWNRADASRRAFDGIWAGAALGLSAYAYSTMRLLMPLLILALVAAYLPARQHLRAVAGAGFAALWVYLPAVIYALLNPGSLVARFQLISIFNTAASPRDVLAHMWRVYTSAFSITFLFQSAYFRQGGELLISLAPLLALGALGLWTHRHQPFWRFVLLGLLMAPVPAALTYDFGHELRNLPAAPFWLLIAALGAAEARSRLGPHLRTVAALAAIAIALETSVSLSDYFTRYPDRIASWNEAGFDRAARAAQSLAQGPAASGRIVVSTSILGGDILYAYYVGEPVEDYRRGGALAAGVTYEQPGAAALAPGTVVVTKAGEVVVHAQLLETVETATTDDWGRPVRQPAYLVWRS